MDLLFIGIGGTFGGLFRFHLGKLLSEKRKTFFPATFFVNLLGALLLGMVVGADIGNRLILFSGEGFLGAFTTFSTFMYESIDLFSHNKLKALLYIFGSLLLGITGYTAGFMLGRCI
ncbi:putative fluoride ion transporter CrcB [bioreactor metagenome]|uniref:Putative fluoride ion transporter CrcB n=1 Tax=bioreactor metagenome TaxID=1076179 RepID=A0A645GTW1_9ZZZZ